MAHDDTETLALYVHWPWCLSKCPYCDFNSHQLDDAGPDQGAYQSAILRDLNHFAEKTKGRLLTSIFFGGGTPSLVDPDTIHTVIEAAENHWGLAKDIEITLEANPTSAESAKFRAFRNAGINRVSIGIQALIDEDLQALGREHTSGEAVRALDIAAAIFNRYTFDLIYARPGQGVGAWADELEQALELAASENGGHVSLYQLTVEPGTAFFRQNIAEANEDLAADLYQLTQDLCGEAGMPAYEVSNHARPGCESRHNTAYWTGRDYIGIGPGAHGRVTAGGVTTATHQVADPARWLDAIHKTGHGTAKVRELSRQERIEELILTGLRLTAGLARSRFRALSGTDVMDAVNLQALAELQSTGLAVLDDASLRVTDQGRPMLNTVIQRLLDEPGTTERAI